MRELFARLDAACAAPSSSKRADAALNEACDGIMTLSREILANPSPGLAGVGELAMVAQYWFRPPPHQGSAWDPKSQDSIAVCALIDGVFALCGGPGRQEHSTAFVRWRQLADEYRRTVYGEDESISERVVEAMRPVEEEIFAQRVEGAAASTVVAEIGAVALFWSEKTYAGVGEEDATTFNPFRLDADEDLHSGALDERSRAHLIQAAAKLYLGGLNG
jgi:hypothetical protein